MAYKFLPSPEERGRGRGNIINNMKIKKSYETKKRQKKQFMK